MHATTSARPVSVRLTRRGRALLVLVLAGLLLTAFSMGRTGSQAAQEAGGGAAQQLEQTTVQPGDSLWSVAERVAPDNDTREVVAQIRRLNDLTGSDLLVGQMLLLPTAA